MSCWTTLGISKTDNQRAIKKAYAKKLKELDIDSQIAQFQELKMAFDEAIVLSKELAVAKLSGRETELPQEDLLTDFIDIYQAMNQQSEDDSMATKSPLEIALEEEKKLTRFSFKERFYQLLSEKAYFSETTKWDEIMQMATELGLQQIMDAQVLLIQFLTQNFPLVSREIRLLIINFSQLEQDERSPLINKQMTRFIKSYPDFGFEFWESIDVDQREKYFLERDQVFQLISSKVPLKALQKRIADCLSQYNDDPFLNLLAAYILILADFRLNNSNYLNQLQLLLAKASDSPHWDYLKEYLLFVIEVKASPNLPVRQLSEKSTAFLSRSLADIPPAVFSLTQGYVAYLTFNKKTAIKNWNYHEYYYRSALSIKEKLFLEETIAEEIAKPSTALEKTKTIAFTAAIVFFLFRLIIVVSRMVR